MTSRFSVGVTFMLWSYYWLSGVDKHYFSKKNTWVDLVMDPNTSINAHHFQKNIAGNLQIILNEIDKYHQMEQIDPIALYAGYFPKEIIDAEQGDKEYANIVNHLLESGIPTIIVIESAQDPYYFVKNRSINPTNPSSQITKDAYKNYSHDDVMNFMSSYFSTNLQMTEQNIWDTREILALNFTHLVSPGNYASLINFRLPHFYLDSRELWYDGEQTMRRMFHWLQQPVDESRLNHWQAVYLKWQQVHFDILRFGWLLPHIVESVVQGYDYDLGSLQLDLAREAIIQGYLLKYHNLNLKTFGLDRFPNNTRELYGLIEPNTLHLL